jgi:hypothetical protein
MIIKIESRVKMFMDMKHCTMFMDQYYSAKLCALLL